MLLFNHNAAICYQTTLCMAGLMFCSSAMNFDVGSWHFFVYRMQRWSLHHELQLFERVLRRTPAPPPAGQQQQLGQQLLQQQEQQQQQHPFAPHLGWALVPIAGLICCMHGLYTQEMQVGFSTAGLRAMLFLRQVSVWPCGLVLAVSDGSHSMHGSAGCFLLAPLRWRSSLVL